ncbi:MAG: hypothetical protein ACRAVC_21600 [Trichormus sp.]
MSNDSQTNERIIVLLTPTPLHPKTKVFGTHRKKPTPVRQGERGFYLFLSPFRQVRLRWRLTMIPLTPFL